MRACPPAEAGVALDACTGLAGSLAARTLSYALIQGGTVLLMGGEDRAALLGSQLLANQVLDPVAGQSGAPNLGSRTSRR